jgi:hypothetical protein
LQSFGVRPQSCSSTNSWIPCGPASVEANSLPQPTLRQLGSPRNTQGGCVPANRCTATSRVPKQQPSPQAAVADRRENAVSQGQAPPDQRSVSTEARMHGRQRGRSRWARAGELLSRMRRQIPRRACTWHAPRYVTQHLHTQGEMSNMSSSSPRSELGTGCNQTAHAQCNARLAVCNPRAVSWGKGCSRWLARQRQAGVVCASADQARPAC